MGRPFPKPAPVTIREALAYVVIGAFLAAVLAGASSGPREAITPDFHLTIAQGSSR